MKNYAKRAAVSLVAGAALLVGAAPAQAAPVITGGLVNVTVFDVIDDVNVLNESLSQNNVAVGAALGVAANVCGVGVNVLATQLGRGPVSCESDAGDQTATITQASRR